MDVERAAEHIAKHEVVTALQRAGLDSDAIASITGIHQATTRAITEFSPVPFREQDNQISNRVRSLIDKALSDAEDIIDDPEHPAHAGLVKNLLKTAFKIAVSQPSKSDSAADEPRLALEQIFIDMRTIAPPNGTQSPPITVPTHDPN